MCGYSITWYPSENFSAGTDGEVTTARSVYWPALACAGAVTSNLADRASSSCAKLTGTLAGDTFQPVGRSRVTKASAAPFVPLVTLTWISRLTCVAVVPPDVAGK